MWLFGILLVLLIFAGIVKLFRSKIYNIVIVHLTSQWYEEVLDLLSSNNKLLDVGIGMHYKEPCPVWAPEFQGTGQALIKNKEIVVKKQLLIDGVDYDLDYIKECQKNISRQKLQKYITVHHQSIMDYRQGGPYDAIYFSASLMILPNPVEALNHVKTMLAPNGKIYVTQTIQRNRSPFIEFVKPLLKYLSTIDFGNVTYEEDLILAFHKANLKLQLDKPISGTSLQDMRSFRLFILESV